MTKLTPAQIKFLARFDEARIPGFSGTNDAGELAVRNGETPTADRLEALGLIRTTRRTDGRRVIRL